MAQQWNERLAGHGIPDAARFDAWVAAGQLTRQDLRRARTWLIVAGAVALVAGVVAIAVPIIASVTIAILVGWVLIAAGVGMAGHAISHRSVVRGLEALLTVVAGLYVLISPLSGTVTLTFVLAVWFFASGTLSLTHATRGWGGADAWINAVNGGLSIILGILIAASLPSSAAWAIGLLVGINLIFWGIRALVGARLLRDLSVG